MTTTIGSYNILHNYWAVHWAESAGLNEEGLSLSNELLKKAAQEGNWKRFSNWQMRSQNISANIILADIVCLQEIAKTSIEELQALTGYQLANACYHTAADGNSDGEYGNAILFNSEKIKLLDSFEIRHELGPFQSTKAAACGIFQIENKIIKVASIHLTGYYSGEKDLEKKQKAKLSGYNELQTYLERLEENAENLDAILIAGDFNESKDEEAASLYRPGLLIDAGYVLDGHFTPTEPLKNRKIDWIFLKPLKKNNFRLKSLELEKLQIQASDHLITASFLESF